MVNAGVRWRNIFAHMAHIYHCALLEGGDGWSLRHIWLSLMSSGLFSSIYGFNSWHLPLRPPRVDAGDSELRVVARAGEKQQPLALGRGHAQGRGARHQVRPIERCAGFDQDGNDVGVALLARDEERGVAAIGEQVDDCARSTECLNARCMPRHGGQVQRRHAIVRG
jgi:hypothetical protein